MAFALGLEEGCRWELLVEDEDNLGAHAVQSDTEHGHRVLIASPVLPYPSRSGNAVRILQLERALRKLGCEVAFVFCPTSCIKPRGSKEETRAQFPDAYFELAGGEAQDGPLQRALTIVKTRFRGRRVPVLRDILIADGLFRSFALDEFRSIVDGFKPTAIVAEYAILSALIRDLAFSGPTVVDTHDVFSYRNQRLRKAGGSALWWSLLPIQERVLLRRFDVALAIQEHEARHFRSLLRNDSCRVETVDILEAPSCEEVLDPGRPTLGFIASDNGHNIEGLRLFVEHHWERVRDQVPDSQLILAGSVCDAPGVRDIPGAVSMGRVDELLNFYASVAAVINPCPSGSGLKMKSVEALAFGKPLVTTEEGAVGLESFAAPALFIKEIGSPGYTEACVELLLDERKRRLAGDAGLRAIQTRAQQSLIRLANAVGIDGPQSLSVSDGSICLI